MQAARAGHTSLGCSGGTARGDRRAAGEHGAHQARGYYLSHREALGEAAFANAWSEGRKLTPEQALEAWQEQEVISEPIATPAKLAGLTAGEMEVLRLVASG